MTWGYRSLVRRVICPKWSVQIPKFDPDPNSNPNPMCFGQMTLWTGELFLTVSPPQSLQGRYNFRNGGTHCDWPVDGRYK